MQEEKIINLWRWFYSNEKLIRESLQMELREQQERIVQSIDNLVIDLGRFSWHIEMGEMKDWAFIISPNGDEELMKLSKDIISHAPELDCWEFHFCKPNKIWDKKLSLYDAEYEIVEIDASKWEFVLKKNSNEKFDLSFIAANIEHIDEETAKTAANIVVLNEIGEEKRILNINDIGFLFKSNQYSSEVRPLNQLKNLI